MAAHNDLGRKGEEKGVEYLVREGYVVLERNWRLKHRELDVICLKGDLLVVVEVKTRDLPEEHPEELLDYRKRRNIRIATDAYIKAKGIRAEVRFDLILVIGPDLKIEHVKEAIQVFE